MTNSNHISIQRCVEFLLRGAPLEPEEHEHLIHCFEWTEAMVRAASQEIKSSGKGPAE
jgi:hypothetical protein